ncbi:tRNA (N(6)-L-threonylcarbamoyladenosine(37)-C(2))-methylthiotransferase MtaB [Marasmitruncus massiliensis]|uniref:tRNA (N(6)-L-threonylcarbamoyladenosine(37)-C(2))- methylthiotransferase MtaB n=1 Tax=Marasmitruncus massiliensis TaxID=1944642 RepID=UPI000C7C40B9|nr:tRNA (N(6)-L-threonylcarbamoyladenosine(37)-C(2))-methylthiotransferase MtaB [Marasmitruncus massiliensis]
MRIAFYTLGCKVNQYETEVLSQLFAADGYDIVAPDETADIYVINSCTVTATGDKKTRQMLRHFKSQNPAAKVALTGCFPQAFPDAAEKLPEADIIMGARGRAELVKVVSRCLATDERIIDIRPHEKGETFERMAAAGFAERTRAFVKIEDGCERYCSYCIIPTARGPVRSKPMDELFEELRGLAASGYQEVVLVGINLSCYGKELGLRLIDAVELACRTKGIQRVRLGSLEPELLTDEDIERMAALPQMCPQFHLSLQSGCDETLKRMNRHYDTAEYTRITESLRRHFDHCAITTDIMVGFPGEDEEEFSRSLAFAEKIAFAKVHVFAYSQRPGTRAAVLSQQVSKAEKASRSTRMIELTERTRADFLQKQVGRAMSVLFESHVTDGIYEGYSENYTPVHVRSGEDLRGTIRPVQISGAESDFCTGSLA